MFKLNFQPGQELRRLQCRALGHKFVLTKEYKTHQKEFICEACKKQYTEDSYGYLTPLTPKLKRINEVMEKFYLRRLSKTA